jgi:hypothetical protein
VSGFLQAQSVFDRFQIKEVWLAWTEDSADTLAHELSVFLGSPDPELRDDLAYSILTSWIYRRNLLSMTTLQSLTDDWRANLRITVASPPAFRGGFALSTVNVATCFGTATSVRGAK